MIDFRLQLRNQYQGELAMQSGKRVGNVAVAGVVSALLVVPALRAEDALQVIKVVGAREDNGYLARSSGAASKTDMDLQDIPQTINVIPAAVIKDLHATSLQDVLKTVPGVGLSTGDGQRDQVYIRGFTAIGDQFVDGFRDDALYFRDLSNIERLEVVKGPAAVLYGRGSSGGLVNRVTKKPGADISEISLSLSDHAGRRGEIDIGQAGESASWRLTGAREKADSYRAQQFLDRTALAPSLALRLSSATRLLLQADYLEDRRLTDFGIPSYNGRPVEVDPGQYYGAANARQADYSQARVVSSAATLTHQFNASLSLRNGLRYYNYTLDRNNTNISGNVNEVAGTMSLAHAKLARQEHGGSNQTELTQKIATGAIQHEVLFGVEFGQQSRRRHHRQPEPHRQCVEPARRPGMATDTATVVLRILEPLVPAQRRELCPGGQQCRPGAGDHPECGSGRQV
jgi:catecholate siderophore receptor